MLKTIETTSILTYNKINDILNTRYAIRQVILDDTAILILTKTAGPTKGAGCVQ